MSRNYARVLALVESGASGRAIAARASAFAGSGAGRLAFGSVFASGDGEAGGLKGTEIERFHEVIRRKLRALAGTIGMPDAQAMVGETLFGPDGLAQAWRPDLVVCAKHDDSETMSHEGALSLEGLGCDVGFLSVPRVGLYHHRDALHSYRHILAMGDLSHAGLDVVRRAAQLADQFNCRLTVAAAMDYTPGFECEQLPVMTPGEFRSATREDLQHRLSEAVARCGTQVANVIVAEGSRQDVQDELVSELHPDLVVADTSARHDTTARKVWAHDLLKVHSPSPAARLVRAISRFGFAQV